MKKLFALVAVALTLCGLLTACGSKTETANDVDLTGFYNALAEQYGWGDDMITFVPSNIFSTASLI
mgnify:CR=1 FL=1